MYAWDARVKITVACCGARTGMPRQALYIHKHNVLHISRVLIGMRHNALAVMSTAALASGEVGGGLRAPYPNPTLAARYCLACCWRPWMCKASIFFL